MKIFSGMSTVILTSLRNKRNIYIIIYCSYVIIMFELGIQFKNRFLINIAPSNLFLHSF